MRLVDDFVDLEKFSEKAKKFTITLDFDGDDQIFPVEPVQPNYNSVTDFLKINSYVDLNLFTQLMNVFNNIKTLDLFLDV